MNPNPSLPRLGLLALLLTLLQHPFATAHAQGTAFTYQGRLDDGGTPANGVYDLQFRLFDVATGGAPIGGVQTGLDVAVANGLFSVTLDFGAQFPGAARWLQLGVRPGSSTAAYTVLAPRQALTPAPYAIHAGSATTVTGPLPASALAGANGSGLTTLNASQLASGTVPEGRLPASVALRTGGNTFAGNQVFNHNVGIGLDAPATTLDVAGNFRAANASGSLTFDGFPPGGGNTLLASLTAASTNWPQLRFRRAGGGSFMDIGQNPQGDFVVEGNDAPRLVVRNGGNVGIGTNTPGTKLEVAGEITCVAVNITSDRNAKERFKAVNPREILDKVARLPITEWTYTSQADARHIGPMAQDFHAAFGLGRDARHITSVDADGIALAAIQGLHQRFEELLASRETELDRLEAENRSLAERLETLERLLKLRAAMPSSQSSRP